MKLTRATGARWQAVRPALGQAGVAFAETLQAKPPQLLRSGQSTGHVEAGEMTLAEVELDRGLIGNLLAAGDGSCDDPTVETHEGPMHFLGALEIKFAGVHPHP